jgi:signal recognition particle receptor subunit beta
MPTIDESHGWLVVRIVYDGPALSGKTTSLRSLAQGLASKVESPEERDGRTLYFDWMDYIGGLYEGRQIRCQVLSVPGQRELSHRRKLLVESADAVVCVLDTRRQELDFGLEWLGELVPFCRQESPPIGIVLQANKRDAPGAVPKDELRARVSQVAPIAVVESVATASDGIRESFVLAVRLALDRVRALSNEGRLDVGKPREDMPAELLEVLKQAEIESPPVKSEPARVSDKLELDFDEFNEVNEIDDEEPAPDLDGVYEGDAERPFVPDPMMPGGMIWPPVDGRALLHEVSSLAIRPTRTPRGDWWGSGSGWCFHSRPRALYDHQLSARDQLVAWARLHAANADQISVGRAVILADAGGGRLRLWQLVRVEAALRERLSAALVEHEPADVARGLIDTAASLISARKWFESAPARLPCNLWTVSANRGYRPSFVGLMPPVQDGIPAEPDGYELVAREFGPHLRELRRSRVDYASVASEIASLSRTESAGPARWLADVMATID